MSDALVAERFIYNALMADEALQVLVDGRVYSEMAPGDAAYPFVIFHCLGSADIDGAGGKIIGVDERYVVKGVGRGESYAGLEDIFRRIQAVLHHSSGVVEDGLVLACTRLYVVKYAEQIESISYRHLGAAFRFFNQG